MILGQPFHIVGSPFVLRILDFQDRPITGPFNNPLTGHRTDKAFVTGADHTKPGVPLKGLVSGPSASQSEGSPLSPIGGHLARFINQWQATTTDVWALQTISLGLTLEFNSEPPRWFIQCPTSRDCSKRVLMEAEIQHLLAIQAIEPVPPLHHGSSFYSILFLVQKKSGGSRAILDLKKLNVHIKYRRFKMESLHSILACIRQGDLLTSIDLREAYLHVPIRPSHRRFLRFCYAGNHFQYRALPFRLSSAPRTFTKLLDVVAARLRATPVRLQCYLDDILIQSSSLHQAQLDLQITIQTLQDHSFSMNLEKSHLFPSTSLVYFGARIDT